MQGGTFIRQRAGGFAWLPGLVHVPSAAFEPSGTSRRSACARSQGGLEDRFGLGLFERYDIDIEHQRIVFSLRRQAGRERAGDAHRDLLARFALLGMGQARTRTCRRECGAASAALVDGMEPRDMWELSTPIFPVDEGTAWALSALVCDRAGGEGIYRGQDGESRVFVMLRDLRPT